MAHKSRIGTRTPLLTIALVVGAAGCSRVWHFLEGVDELGAGYVFDGVDMIVHTSTEPYDGAGTLAVPPTVLGYDYDDDFVVVSSENPHSKAVVYWLIVKSQPSTQGAHIRIPNDLWPYYDFANVLGPMTLGEFRKARAQYRVADELSADQ